MHDKYRRYFIYFQTALYFLLINVGAFLFLFFISPLIIKRFGIEEYGIIMLLQSIIIILSTITDYAFLLIGVKRVVEFKSTHSKLEQIYNESISQKIFLLFISSILFFFIVSFHPKLKDSGLFSVLSIALLFARAFNPSWFLRGVNSLKIFCISFIISKIITFLVLYYIIFDSKYVNLSIGVMDLIVNIGFYIAIKYQFNFQINWLSFKATLNGLKEHILVFYSQFLTSLYTLSYPFILALFVSKKDLGIYSVSERIFIIFMFSIGIFVNLLLPFFVESHKKNQYKINYQRYSKLQFLISSGYMILMMIVFFLAPYIASYMSPSDSIDVSHFLRLLMMVPLIVSLRIVSFIFLVIYEKQRYILYSVCIGTLLSIGLNSVLSYQFSIKGTIYSMYIAESIVTLYVTYQFYRLKFIRSH